MNPHRAGGASIRARIIPSYQERILSPCDPSIATKMPYLRGLGTRPLTRTWNRRSLTLTFVPSTRKIPFSRDRTIGATEVYTSLFRGQTNRFYEEKAGQIDKVINWSPVLKFHFKKFIESGVDQFGACEAHVWVTAERISIIEMSPSKIIRIRISASGLAARKRQLRHWSGL